MISDKHPAFKKNIKQNMLFNVFMLILSHVWVLFVRQTFSEHDLGLSVFLKESSKGQQILEKCSPNCSNHLLYTVVS